MLDSSEKQDLSCVRDLVVSISSGHLAHQDGLAPKIATHALSQLQKRDLTLQGRTNAVQPEARKVVSWLNFDCFPVAIEPNRFNPSHWSASKSNLPQASVTVKFPAPFHLQKPALFDS